MIYTTTQTKIKKTILTLLKYLLVAAFWLLIWEVASLLLSRENGLMLLLLPRPVTVFKTFLKFCGTVEFFTAVLSSLKRVFIGFLLGTVAGFLFGLATHFSRVLNALFSPLFKIIRAVPVVAFIILLYLFLNSALVPETIVFLMVLPILWQTIHDSLASPDEKMAEMARVFKINKFKKLCYIDLPLILPQIVSSAITALGLAWKSGIAAEVICETKNSLGELLKTGKETINYDETYAITLTVIILSILIEFLLKGSLKHLLKAREKAV